MTKKEVVLNGFESILDNYIEKMPENRETFLRLKRWVESMRDYADISPVLLTHVREVNNEIQAWHHTYAVLTRVRAASSSA